MTRIQSLRSFSPEALVIETVSSRYGLFVAWTRDINLLVLGAERNSHPAESTAL